MLILSIETSCDETSTVVIREGREAIPCHNRLITSQPTAPMVESLWSRKMLTQQEINQIIETIKTTAKPDKIYLFGSYALGKATSLSDLDLLVVDDSGRNKKALALEISKSLFPRNFGLDLMVTSSAELSRRSQLNFWREIITKGKKIYERN